MSAPLKPWESGYGSGGLQSSSTMQNVVQTPVGRFRMTPPIPPRPNTVTGAQYNSPYNSYGSYGYNRGYGSMYSPYSSLNSYGGYMGGYGGYGNYGGYNNYGGPNYGFGPESSFIRLAEESTRPAFQSIESVVRAFSGISMMMDSTFFAITSSFRAVLGIADNIGQLRSMFGQIWSSFALFRLISWIYRKILSLFGIKIGVTGGNKAWEQAVNGSTGPPISKGHNWPIFLFLGIILSAPYLISKMIPSVDETQTIPSEWPSPGVPVKVLYDFQASSQQELSVSPGETILVAPKSVQEQMGLMSSGWVYAIKNNNSNLNGIVPRNYLQPPSNSNKRTVNNTETAVPISSNPSESRNFSQVPDDNVTINNNTNTENT